MRYLSIANSVVHIEDMDLLSSVGFACTMYLVKASNGFAANQFVEWAKSTKYGGIQDHQIVEKKGT
jgi:hypothetical protein